MSRKPMLPEKGGTPTILKGVTIDQCPSGWCFCPDCQTCFTVEESLRQDRVNDSCPNCGNKALEYQL
jgi:hypothetical protein